MRYQRNTSDTYMLGYEYRVELGNVPIVTWYRIMDWAEEAGIGFAPAGSALYITDERDLTAFLLRWA